METYVCVFVRSDDSPFVLTAILYLTLICVALEIRHLD